MSIVPGLALVQGKHSFVRAICRFQNDSVSIHTRSLWSFLLRCYCRHLWHHEVAWDCDVIADIDNGWYECIIPNGNEINTWNTRFDSRQNFSYFRDYFYIPCYKRIKNICPCIVEIRGTFGYVSARASPTCGPFYWHGLTLIPAWISNYIHHKV